MKVKRLLFSQSLRNRSEHNDRYADRLRAKGLSEEEFAKRVNRDSKISSTVAGSGSLGFLAGHMAHSDRNSKFIKRSLGKYSGKAGLIGAGLGATIGAGIGYLSGKSLSKNLIKKDKKIRSLNHQP